MASSEISHEAARFMAAIYQSDVRFSYLPGFARRVREEISRQATCADDLLDIVSTAGITAHDQVLASAEDTRRHVEARDLRTIHDNMKGSELLAADFSPEAIHSEVVAACEHAVQILADSGISVDETPDIFVVDRMPEPYDRKPAATALAIDSEDTAEFGIPQGIYFQRSHLTPYYSQFIALHEMLHVLLGCQDPTRNAHGLEEGLSDVLGSIWLAHQILGRDLTRRLFVLNRLSSDYNPFWERYLDTARQAFALILAHGLDWVLQLLRGGRSELYKVEEFLLRAPRTTVRADLRDEFTSLAWELLFTYPRSFVCSPAAFLFAGEAQSGLTVREVAVRAGLSPEIAGRAARELRDDHGVVFLRKDELVIIEATPATMFAQDWFRYESR